LKVQSFTTSFFYGRKNAYLKIYTLKLYQTLLRDENWWAICESISLRCLGNLGIKTEAEENSKLGFKDIFNFLCPSLEKEKPLHNP
jgi:hypothetical protein